MTKKENNEYLGLENNELWIIKNQQELIMNNWKKHPKNSE